MQIWIGRIVCLNNYLQAFSRKGIAVELLLWLWFLERCSIVPEAQQCIAKPTVFLGHLDPFERVIREKRMSRTTWSTEGAIRYCRGLITTSVRFLRGLIQG